MDSDDLLEVALPAVLILAAVAGFVFFFVELAEIMALWSGGRVWE